MEKEHFFKLIEEDPMKYRQLRFEYHEANNLYSLHGCKEYFTHDEYIRMLDLYLDEIIRRDIHVCQGTSAHPRYYAYPNRYIDDYKKRLFETDSRPKNPPQKRLSKKEFYKLLEKEPWHLYTNVCDEIEERISGKFIWLPLCKEELPLKEVMTLRKRYFPDLFK